MSFLQDLFSPTEKLTRMNALDYASNPFYELYLRLTGYPFSIVVPIFLSVVFLIIAWLITNRWLKKSHPQRFFWHYIATHIAFAVIFIIFSIAWGLLIQHISLFWSVGFTFYGAQVIMPIFLLVASALAGFTNLKWRPVKDFRNLLPSLKILGVCLATIILSVSYYAFFIEPFDIEVTHHQISFKDEELKLRIVHLTDIQTDRLSSREEEVIEQVNDLEPDIIVLTGDYFNGGQNTHPNGFASARHLLKNIKAKYGIFAVSSDSNHFRDHEPLFNGLPITFLENKSAKISIDGEDLHIIGVSRRFPDIDQAWEQVPTDANTLLLYHGPEIFFATELAKYQPDLLLVGHTHGGQIALPFIGPLTSATPHGREFAKGWHERNNIKMYVNRGIGMEGWWAPKIRFLTRPEIAVIEAK